MNSSLYAYRVVQDGTLPLTVDGQVVPCVEHACTSVVVWPLGTRPERRTTLVIDPCFTARGLGQARARMAESGSSLHDVGYFFVTHPHGDHSVYAAGDMLPPGWKPFTAQACEAFPEVRVTRCPGHHPRLNALSFPAEHGSVWVVGDAILDYQWLLGWGYYWPNGYTPEEVRRTWGSVARILSQADVVVPGHGAPIAVTPQLLGELLANWPEAEESAACPDVEATLRSRLESLGDGSRAAV